MPDLARTLARFALERRGGDGPVVLGLSGAQGSGKSTLARRIAAEIEEGGGRAVALSLDDVYLGRSDRLALAVHVHPLFAVRGPPGTHDVASALDVLRTLKRAEPVDLPAFDKATDDRRPRSVWRRVDAPCDVVVFEGWCLGAVPQPETDLASPVNDLERNEDPDGVWRRRVDEELDGPYRLLFAEIDVLAFLQAPGFDVVRGWRGEQEAELRAGTGRGMSEAELDRFVRVYERLTRWMLAATPARADCTIALDAERRVLNMRFAGAAA